MKWWNPFKAISSVFSGFFDKRLWSPVGGRATTAREDVSEDSALNYSAVWCATRLLCGTGAGLPLGLYRGLDDENRASQRKHQAFRLLNRRPNPEMTAFNFRSVMWQWQVNWGNAYAEVEREGNDPDGGLVALWPLHPSRVDVKRDEGNNLFYHVRDDRPGEEGVDLEPWQMLHIPSIITYDGIVGHGVISHARESIGAGIAAEKYGAHWFGGAAVPRAVIEHPGRSWDEEARNAFRKEWADLYGNENGVQGERVALLMGGATLKPLSLSNEDSQFLETRQFGVEEIARWYGVPPHLLQHLLRATFNNIEHLGISFVQYSLIEWLNVWEQCICQRLLTADEQDDLYAEHNVAALMRGDSAARASFYQTMVNSALMTRNEARKKENLDPVPGGDTFVIQGAMVPLDEDGKPESKFAESGQQAEEPADMPADEEPMEDGEEILAAVASRIRVALHRDLSRILTKESNRMKQCAKKPERFVDSVDKFYAEHTDFVRDAVSAQIEALNECGAEINVEQFVADWVEEGKELILKTSGLVTANDLSEAVKGVIELARWKSRPEKAIEGIAAVNQVLEAA